MTPISPHQRQRIQAAMDYVLASLQAGAEPAQIISDLVERFGASVPAYRGHGYTMRCAGVAGNCTWSKDDGLLKSWRGNANTRLASAAMADLRHG